MKKTSAFISVVLISIAVTLAYMTFDRERKAKLPPRIEIPLFVDADEGPVWRSDLDYQEEKNKFEASVSANAYMVLDTKNDAVLLERNSKGMLAPASTTKMMTALVARDLYDLDEVSTIGLNSIDYNGIRLYPGENVLIKDLIAAALISSANDAAWALANHQGQPDLFYSKMNEKVAELNLDSTSFTNAAGYDNFRHLSTARDLVVLMRAAYADPFLAELMGTEKSVISNVEETVEHPLLATNQFLNSNPDVKAGKTGTTGNAGEVLVTVVENGHDLVIAVMGSSDRYADTQKLMQFVAEHF